MGCTKTYLWAYADSKGPDQPVPSMQSDQALPFPVTESLDTSESLILLIQNFQ